MIATNPSNIVQPTAEPQKTVSRRKVLTLVPKPKPEKIRTELNIEKWPAIWNPTHSKIHSRSNVKSRTLVREFTNPDGMRTLSTVTINPIAQLGELTTEDQRTLYALIKHWEDHGKPVAETPFSTRHLAKLLNKKGWGTNVIDAVTGSLERLRGTMLVWTHSYRTKDERVEDSETVYINILSKLKIRRRKVDGHLTTEAGYFQFDDHILRNLLDNYTKPFLFDVFMQIRGEIALKLYSYLDLLMADKTRYERCTKDLFEDLGLQGESYRNPSKRKQNLEKAFKELRGVMLTTGALKSATIEKTKDGKDYKAIFQKGARAAELEQNDNLSFAPVAEQQVVINDYSKTKDPLVVQAEEVLQYFYKRFHGVETHHAQSKETNQALSLVTQHGFEKAKYVVSFSHEAAATTKYLPQTFGGILQYASRAIADFDRMQHDQARALERQQHEAARVAEEEQRRTRGEQRLAVLTPEQYQARFEQAKQFIIREHPMMARLLAGRESSALHNGAIRARMIQQLDTEEMSLLVIEDPSAPESLIGLAQNLPL